MSPLGTKYIHDTDDANTDNSTADAITLSPFQTLAFTMTTGSMAPPPALDGPFWVLLLATRSDLFMGLQVLITCDLGHRTS
jgi:hypothetical protein